MKIWIMAGGLAVSLALVSCDRPDPVRPPPPATAPVDLGAQSPEPPAPVISPTGRQVRVELVPGQPTVLNVLPAPPKAISDQLAPFIRDAGFSCDSVIEANQLQQQDGQDVPIFKIQCSGGHAYRASLIGEKSYIKPWTGVLLGR